MMGQGAGSLSPLATLFMLAVVATGIALGLVRRGGRASDPDGWSTGDDGPSDHCLGHDGGSCDGH